MKVSIETELEVLTGGEWWQATVVEVKEKSARVHYKGGVSSLPV